MRLILLISCLLCLPLHAGWTRIGEKWADNRYVPSLSVQEHYDIATQAFEAKKWDDAIKNYQVILHHFEDTPFFADSLYYVAVSYYFCKQFERADKCFSRYLDLNETLAYFEKAVEYKYQIAEDYRDGKKRPLFGVQGLPRIWPSKGSAMLLYDEVVAALPSRDVAAQALLSKSILLCQKKEYKEGIETLQKLIRRFPKHQLATEAYLMIGEIYLKQIKREAQNPDFIALAQVNMQRFSKSFPGDARRRLLEAQLAQMEEMYAHSVYETARFYERIKRPHSATMYYRDTVRRYPETESAQKSRERLENLERKG